MLKEPEKKPLEIKNLMIEIQMATEGLEEKKNRRQKEKKNVDKKIRSIQEARYVTKKSSRDRPGTSKVEKITSDIIQKACQEWKTWQSPPNV